MKYISLLLVFILGFSCSRSLDRSIELLKNPRKYDEAVFDIVLSRKSATKKLLKRMRNKKTDIELKVKMVPVLYRIYAREKNEEIYHTLVSNLNYPDDELKAAIIENLADFDKEGILQLLFKQLQTTNTNIILPAMENIQYLMFEGKTNFTRTNFQRLKELESSRNIDIVHYSHDIRGRYISSVLMPKADKYIQSFQKDEVEKIYKEIFEIHPTFHGALISYINYLYKYVSKSKAVRLAKQNNKMYTIKRRTGSIKIDGKLDDLGWKRADKLDAPYMNLHSFYERKELAFPTYAKIMYDNAYIYVAFYGFDDAITNLRVTEAYKTRDSHVFNDDSFEVFMSADIDSHVVRQFLLNSRNIVCDVEVASHNWNFEYNANLKSGTFVATNENYWSAEFKILTKDIYKTGVKSGDVYRGSTARTKTTGENLILNPWPVFGDNWHTEYFGYYIFE